jgi:hypothetical protein
VGVGGIGRDDWPEIVREGAAAEKTKGACIVIGERARAFGDEPTEEGFALGAGGCVVNGDN